MKTQAFEAEILDGHKGPAILIPFDPAKIWRRKPRPVFSESYGWRPGHLVEGRINKCPFESWIGLRWGRFFMLVDDELRDRAGVEIGDRVKVVMTPRSGGPSDSVRA